MQFDANINFEPKFIIRDMLNLKIISVKSIKFLEQAMLFFQE